jgi:lipopolysaccharide/colanic/teichoic acid biosynthesis glycosyltransferase
VRIHDRVTASSDVDSIYAQIVEDDSDEGTGEPRYCVGGVGGGRLVADELGFGDSGAVSERPLGVVGPYFGRRYAVAADGTARSAVYATTFKRQFDVFLALSLLVLLAPLFALIMGVILAVDRRPVFFVQQRVGRGGRSFPLIKFRTMVRDAETILECWKDEDPDRWQQYVQNNFKVCGDPRLIRFGAFMRRFSLDELPQLWNVVRGEMSLVGPRPLIAEEVPYYSGDMRLYNSVRPGVTGIWQVSGRSSTTFDERGRLDGVYIRSISLGRDCQLLFRTISSVAKGKGAY